MKKPLVYMHAAYKTAKLLKPAFLKVYFLHKS